MSLLTAYNKFIEQALKYGFSLYGLTPTGQTVQFRAGDDGAYEKGYPRQGNRFIDNGDGTITDNASGLMWVKEPGAIGGAFGTPGNSSPMDWEVAIDACEGLTYAGHSDWRLPNIKELHSIIDQGRHQPAIDATFFPSTRNTWYWSSTTFFDNNANAFRISFTGGTINNADKELDPWYLRPVRLGFPTG